MKLNNIDKIVLGLLTLLIIGDLFILCNRYIQNKNSPFVIIRAASSEVKSLPKNIKEDSKKYNVYPELFNSDQKVFTYNYDTNSFDIKNNWLFHKDMTKKLKEANLNYKYIIQKNAITEITTIGDKKTCNAAIVLNQTHEKILDIADECFLNACIIDSKNNNYIILTRDTDNIMSVLKEENTKTK